LAINAVISKLFKMSAVRYAMLQFRFFIVLLVLASVILQRQITFQAYDDIDQELILFAEDLAISFDEADGMPKWYTLGEDELVVNRIDRFRSDDNKVYGLIKHDVFNTNGFSTLPDDQLFEARFLRELYIDEFFGGTSGEFYSELSDMTEGHHERYQLKQQQ
jgi:hypothetical protein